MAGIFGQYPGAGGSSGGGLSSISFSVGVLDGGGANQNGASVSSNSIFLQSATSVFPGLVNSSDQTFSGVKTFSSSPIFPSVSHDAFLKTDGSNNLAVGSIDLTMDVTGLLPLAKMNLSVGSTTGHGPINPVAMNPFGATLGSNTLYLQIATATFSGLVTQSGFQTFGGTKQFLSGPLIQGISASSVLKVNGSNRLVSASVTLTTDVTGILPAGNLPPLSSITGSVSLTTQVSGLLPLAKMNLSVGTLDAAAASANGATLGSNSLYLQSASGTSPGLVVSTSTQILGGVKIFANNVTVPGGVVGAPSLLLGTSESNTGIYKPAVNQLGISVGGAQQGVWSSGGYTTTTSLTNNMLLKGSGGNLTMTVQSTSGYSAQWSGTAPTGSSSSLKITNLGIMSWSPARGQTARVFQTGSSTYTPTPGAVAAKVTVVGGGGGGGGAASSVGTSGAGAGGGGGGGLIIYIANPATATLSVGAGGGGGSAGNNAGTAGGTSWFSLTTSSVSCTGGAGGDGSAATSSFPSFTTARVAGGIATTSSTTFDNLTTTGSYGEAGTALSVTQCQAGTGAPAPFGLGFGGRGLQGGGTGLAALGFGSGGGGGSQVNNSGAAAGGSGAGGVIVIEEYFY